MKYNKIVVGKFISRPNRFIANVSIDGIEKVVHVKNTGRCKELLKEGATVYLSKSDNPERKTEFDLIAVEKFCNVNSTEKLLVNMDSQIVNDVAEEWLKSGKLFTKDALIKREVFHGASRFDFYVEDSGKKAFLEVKGVTLENDGVASFPDAPTLRGIKHINELCQCVEEGYGAYILFIIQMSGMKYFTPASEIHKDFSDALKRANDKGVKILCIDCIVTPDSIVPNKYVKVVL